MLGARLFFVLFVLSVLFIGLVYETQQKEIRPTLLGCGLIVVRTYFAVRLRIARSIEPTMIVVHNKQRYKKAWPKAILL